MNVDLSTLVALDVETSGPDPITHQLLAAALVPLDARVEPLTVYVRPESVTWTDVAQQYFASYRFEWEMQARAPETVMSEISRYLENSFSASELLLVGHNVGFDFSFLKQLMRGRTFPRVSHRTIDTHTMLRTLYWLGKIPESACTSTGAFEYFKVPFRDGNRHTALGDAVATRELFLKLLFAFEDDLQDNRAVTDLRVSAASRRGWP